MSSPEFVFPPPPVPSVAVQGSAQRWAVGRVFCVGRNYADHAREMGSDPSREPPFFFMKPAQAVVDSDQTVPYALATRDLHHEIELVLAVGAPVLKANAATAAAAIWGVAAGLDMTRRDLQAEAKAAGRPWCTAKGFDQSAIVGPLRPLNGAPCPRTGAIALSVNGTPRQHGDLADMIWSPAEVVATLSQFFHLQPGDLIFTGTPEGVGPVQPGDVLVGTIAEVGTVTLTLAAPR